MAVPGVVSDAVKIQCVCGGVVEFAPQALGRVIRCPHCRRYLRPALQFLLMDQSLAPNLTAQCTCGRFIVAEPGMAGQRAHCNACKSHFILPQPVVRFNAEPVVRVPRKVLENQLKRPDAARQRVPVEMARLTSAAHAGRISLRPGEHICVNPNCGALLSARGNVCSKCGTNRLTGERYDVPGPARDPVGRWEEP